MFNLPQLLQRDDVMLPVDVKDQESMEAVERKEPVFGGQDIREIAREGTEGVKASREKVKGWKRGPEVCGVCYGVCCGAARELIVLNGGP